MQKKHKLIDKYKQIGSSSNFHEKIRSILIEDPFFKNLKCYQEVPVSYLCQGYFATNHHVDWYIEELRTVIELHGRQHYQRVNFGNKPYIESVMDFNNIRYRDNVKKTAILENDYEYVEISYKYADKITAEILKNFVLKTGE